ncbi:MAG TPA: FxsB family cyclophane-forming radical SAM/SPASM peptide maturase [Actinocrinis sp.]|nr:FxsB family cyclophane-forming radical SAM/SPASM peptide maturase [Actinocrinis sp.]
MDHGSLPFRQFVIKVHSRCDLACNHCYVYEHADQSWRGRPRDISPETVVQLGRRIAEHAASHALPEVRIVLHGGEPLLLGAARTRETLKALDAAISPVTRLDLRIHTNGVLLSEAYCDLFAEYSVKVGVSLDGNRAANDRHRLYRDGRSSYHKVVAALELLRRPEYRDLYSGILCTVDIANDPIAVYQALLEQKPPRIDLLLPHATWKEQPPGLSATRDVTDPTRAGGEYAQWLTAVFDEWDADRRPMPIRMFESVLAALYGRPSTTEALGLDPVDLLVIETDGTLEQVDSLKTTYDGAAATGLDVWRHSLDEAAAVTGIAVRQQGIDGVCATCRACPVVQICGGGLYPHRYDPGADFDNPSVYCSDLRATIDHILRAESAQGRGVPDAPAQEPVNDRHGLSEEEFARLAAGFGDTAAMEQLVQTQASIQRDLLAMVGRRGPQYDQHFTDAWDLLASLDNSTPAAVASALEHPYTRVWAVKLLTDIGRGQTEDADLRHLEAIAASAQTRTRRLRRVAVPVRGGTAPLPGFGSLAAGTGERVWIEAGAGRQPALAQPLRRLTADGLTVFLEDTDPYRDCHGYLAERQTSAEVDEWQRTFAAAVDYLQAHLPAYLPGLRAGLRAIAPMRRAKDGTHRSAAARQAFGAVGIALPADPALLGLLLIHEFQHVKLGALLDMYELYDVSDTEPRHYAPWRPDPRPFEGLLQGTYAHIAVVDFWRVRRTLVTGEAREAAQEQFARWRMHTAEAVTQLLAAGSLTGLGEQFVRAMGQTVEPWLAEQVDARVQDAAHRSAQKHRADFMERLCSAQ